MPGVGIHRPVGFFRQFTQPTLQPVRLDVRKALSIDTGCSAVGFAAPVGEQQDIFAVQPVAERRRSDTWVIPSLWRATPPVASELFPEVVDSSPISFALATSCVDPEPRPLCSPGITPVHRSYGPLRHPTRPGLSLAGVRLEVRPSTVSGFPCCVRSPCTCPGAPGSPLPRRNRWIVSLCPIARASWMPATAAFPVIQPGRLPHCPFRGLHSVHYSLSRRAGTRSPSRPRRPSTPKASTDSLPPRLLRLLPAGATSYRVGIAPTEDPRLCTAH